tara:strand:+ start:383801 stop:388447 length:4647 start_codon:yes stop_codon:yes gene_type:complete
VPRSQRAIIGGLKLDTAVELNRQSTPPEKVAQRSASRYSISETNALSPDQIRERLEQIRPGDRRPTWVKFLDLIDAPRNVVAGGIADVFLPEAKRAALTRGEFDQFGNVKIQGADLLRAMGFENKVVNAVAGFGVDILTDPITWIGGPIGGLKSVGTRGAVEVSTKGSRALRAGIKAAGSGRTVADDATRTLIDKTLAWGRATGEIADDADGQAIGAFLSKTIYGDRGAISEIAGKAGLGGLTRGGTLSEDLFKLTDDVEGVLDDITRKAGDDRINATKDFLAQHTSNPGLNLTGGRGGIQVGHIPFTTKTLTVPTSALTGNKLDKLPINGLIPGRQQVIQNAFAKVRSGNPAAGAAIVRAHNELSEVTKIATNIERLFDASYDGLREGIGSPAAREAFDGEVVKLAEWADRAKQRLVVDANEIDSIDDMNDLVATAQMHTLANAHLRKAEAMIKQRDETGALGRFTAEDIGRARRERQGVVDEAAAKLGLDPEAAFDDLLDTASQDGALGKLIEERKRLSGERVAKLMTLADEDLVRAESVVDAFHKVTDAAAEIELLQGLPMHRAVGSENRLLAEASRTMLGIDDRNLGMMPLGTVAKAFEKMAPDWSSWISERGRGIATSLGGLGGIQEETRSAIRRMASGADDRANVLQTQFKSGGGRFTKGLAGIAKDSGVKSAAEYDRLAMLVTARVEDSLRASAGLGKLAAKTTDETGELSAAGRFYQQAIADGFIADEALRADIDQLAKETSDYLRELGNEMMLRGEVDDLLDQYLPVRLGTNAEGQARAVQKIKGGNELDAAGKRVGQALNDPAKARMTNLVEFTNADGVNKKFMLLEDEVWKGMDEADLERLALEDPAAAQRVQETLETIAEFEEIYGADELVKRDRSRGLMPFELNDYAQSHALDGLVGGPLVSGNNMFETNMMNLLYHRTRSHHIAQAEAAMKEVIEPFVLLNIRGADHRIMRAGSKATMRDGTVLERIGDGRYKHGGTTYRHMSDAKIDPDSLFNPMSVLGEDAHGALVPEQLVVAMERMSQVLKPETMPTLLKMADKTTSLFKISTLAHPSWTVGNVVGNTILMALDIPDMLTPSRIKQFGRLSKEATKMTWGKNLNKLNGSKTIMVGGRPRRIDEIIQLAEEGGIMTGGGVHGDLVRQWLGRQSQRATPITTGEGRIASIGDRFRTAKASKQAELSRLKDGGELGRMDKLRANIAGSKTGVVDKAITAWFGANGAVDDGYRLAHFMMMLDDGMDPIAAAERTKRAMLNFGDMSSFERNWVRPLVPFYSWTRASLPNMMMRAIRQPQHITAVPKLVTALEEGLVGQDRIPRWQRPSWLNETLAIQTGTDPETAFLLGTLLPQEGVAQVVGGALGAAGAAGLPTGFDGQDMIDAMNWGYSQTGPAVKVPTELAFQRESFSGREIGTGAGDGDISLNDYLLGQVRALRETGIGLEKQGSIAKAYEQQGLGGAIARAGVGGRFSPALTEESRNKAFFFELRDRESELRKAIKRTDDPEKQDELRVQLLALYKNHIERGGDPEDVPKWARSDLAAFGF